MLLLRLKLYSVNALKLMRSIPPRSEPTARRLGKPVRYPERLFEPFWSEHGRGRGIGLYQSRQLVTSEGGSLEAITRDDQPLRFVLMLPT